MSLEPRGCFLDVFAVGGAKLQAMKLTDILNTPLTEVPRLDSAIREHEKLERRFEALIDLMVERQLITRDEAMRLRNQDAK